MALTQRIVATVYAIDGNNLTAAKVHYFPYNGNKFYPLVPTQTILSTTINSVVEEAPTGLRTSPRIFLCSETVAQLITNGI